jgi:tetratricopeptide (TPR) repeat protein
LVSGSVSRNVVVCAEWFALTLVAQSHWAHADPVGRFPDVGERTTGESRAVEHGERPEAPRPSRPDVPLRPRQSGSQALLERGARHEEAGRLAEAAAAYTEAVNLDASNGRALLSLGRLRVRMNDIREAETIFSAATNFSDVAAPAFAERARLRKARGQDSDALLDLENAVALSPEETAWAEELGRWYVARRAWLPALSVYRRLSVDFRGTEREKEMGLRVRALRILSGELDPVARGRASDYSFVRRALARLGTR